MTCALWDRTTDNREKNRKTVGAAKHMEICFLHAVYFTLLELCTKAQLYSDSDY